MATEYVVEAAHQGGMHFVASIGERAISLDHPLAPGESGAGPRPMEVLLASLASCAGGTVAALLRRTQQPLPGLTVRARGLRRSEHPTVFTEISLEFLVADGVDSAQVAKAIQQAEDLVCPVWAMLKPSVRISFSLGICEA